MRTDRDRSTRSFLAELKRRKVIRVAVVYAAVSWLIIEVSETLFSILLLPEELTRALVALLMLGFPVAIVLAWAFELTPDGVRPEATADPETGQAEPGGPSEGDERSVVGGADARPDDFAPALRRRTVDGQPVLSGRGMAVGLGFGILLALVGFGAYGWFTGPGDGEGTAGSEVADAGASPASERHSIAVLPFDNLSADPDNAYFAAGIHEEILTQLSKIGELRVISRTSVQPYADTDRNLREIGRELGASVIVEGSAQRAGDEVRVTAQLIDAETDEHLWAESYDRSIDDIFAIQSELAIAIAEALQARLAPEEVDRIESRPTENLAAYELYLRAGELGSLDRASNETAIELLRQAVRLDTAFADAYAGIAGRYMQRVQAHGYPREWADSGVALAERAIELDPELPSAYARLGVNLSHLGRFEESRRAYLRALELNPSDATALGNMAANAHWTGRYDQMIQYAQRALPLDPTSPYPPFHLALAYFLLDRDDEAEHWFDVVFDRNPDFLFGHALRVYFDIVRGEGAAGVERAINLLERAPDNVTARVIAADAALFTGDYETARRHYEALVRTAPDQRNLFARRSYRTLLAHTLQRTGEPERAERLLAEAVEHAEALIADGDESPDIRLDIATAHALRGDLDLAFTWLERARDSGHVDVRVLAIDPMLAALRDDARYQELVDRGRAEIAEMRRRVEREAATGRE